MTEHRGRRFRVCGAAFVGGVLFGFVWYFVFHSGIARGEARRLLQDTDDMLDPFAVPVAIIAALVSFVFTAVVVHLLHVVSHWREAVLPGFLRSIAGVRRVIILFAIAFAGASVAWIIVVLVADHGGSWRALSGMTGSVAILSATLLHPLLWRCAGPQSPDQRRATKRES